MRIQQIKLKELIDYVNSEEFAQLNEIPITKLRAESQVLNPRAESDDIVLTVAYNNENKVIGYVGALPDLIKGSVKVAWNTCWYSDSNEGGTFALPLFLQFVKDYKGKVLFQDLTPHTTKILRSLPNYFSFIGQKTGVKLFLRSCLAKIVPQKVKWTKSIRWLFSCLDFLLNLPIEVRLKVAIKKNSTDIQSEIVTTIDEEVGAFVEKHNNQELTKRGVAELNWILHNKWVKEGAKQDKETEKDYFFTYRVKKFRYHVLKMRKGRDLIAVVILRQRNSTIETSYLYVEGGFSIKVTQQILAYIAELNCSTITTFHPDILKALEQTKFPILHKRNQNREIVVGNPLVEEIGKSPIVQDGDGDVVFT